MRQKPQKSWGFGYYRKLTVITSYTLRKPIRILFCRHAVRPCAFIINPTHRGERVYDVLYGIFTVVRNACADSVYQAFFSVDEKEPGFEASTASCSASVCVTLYVHAMYQSTLCHPFLVQTACDVVAALMRVL